MIATLRYRFIKCEKLSQIIIQKWKGNEPVREHKYYNEDEVNRFREKSKENPEMQLYVELSIELAPRIQDMSAL